MRGETFTPPPAAKAYTNKQSIEDALEVAEAILMLRGFSGSGKGTLPFILEEVRQSWVLYGGQGAAEETLSKLASEGRSYVVATLEHFGRVRHAAIASKNPLSLAHERRTTDAATQSWARHIARLLGAPGRGLGGRRRRTPRRRWRRRRQQLRSRGQRRRRRRGQKAEEASGRGRQRRHTWCHHVPQQQSRHSHRLPQDR